MTHGAFKRKEYASESTSAAPGSAHVSWQGIAIGNGVKRQLTLHSEHLDISELAEIQYTGS